MIERVNSNYNRKKVNFKGAIMKKIKALHIASFNGNIGDNANHNGFRRKLENGFQCDIDYDEVEIREFYQSWNIRNFNSEEFIQVCNSYSLIIIGGGNFFELKWDYSHTGTTINISDETLDKIKTPIFFNAVGCDVSKGVNKSTISKFENFLNKITNSNNYLISVRNDGSYDTIHKLYGDKYDEKIYKVPDGGFFVETKKSDFPEFNKDLKSIGINVATDMKEIRFPQETENDINYDEFIDGFSKVINKFLENNREYQIIFYPHIYSDLRAISELLEKISDSFRRTRIVVAPCLTGSGSEEYIFGLYKKCEFILGMRFHSNVCAIAQEIPTIGLCSYKKIHDLYSELNLLDRLVYVNKKGFAEKLDQQIKYLVENSKIVKARYAEVKEVINNEGYIFYQQVKIWAEENFVI